MIDKERFKYWMTVLADRTGKVLGEATAREYFAALTAELDTPSFERGARECFKSCTYFPTVREIVDAARPPMDWATRNAAQIETTRASDLLAWRYRKERLAAIAAWREHAPAAHDALLAEVCARYGLEPGIFDPPKTLADKKRREDIAAFQRVAVLAEFDQKAAQRCGFPTFDEWAERQQAPRRVG